MALSFSLSLAVLPPPPHPLKRVSERQIKNKKKNLNVVCIAFFCVSQGEAVKLLIIVRQLCRGNNLLLNVA
jgi:hypothetical protein